MPAQNRNALARVIASFAAAAAMAAPAIGMAAVSTFSPHCSNCHGALTNGTGYPGGAIRASKNPTFLKQKLLAGMGSPTNDILTDTDIVNITNNMATLGVTAAPSISTAATLPGGTYNSFYSTTIAATGAPTPASNPGMGLAAGSPAATFPATPAAFRLTGGSLPPGMSLNGSTGVISGTPTTAGAYSPQITVSNMILPNAVRTFSLTIAKINQTVTFSSAPLVTPTYSVGGTFSVSATSTSGLTVTYSDASSTCNVNASTGLVTIVSAGSCSITGTQAGNTNYNSDSAIKVVTINKANKTISFSAAPSPTYSSGGTFTVSATATGGDAVTYASATPTVCSASGTTTPNTVSILTAGTCTITANSAASTNYNVASQVTQNITIAKANKTISFGAAPTPSFAPSGTFTVSASATGGDSVTYGTTTPSVCTASGTTSPSVTMLTAGTCTVTANSAATTNYNVATQVTQNVTIAATVPGAPTIGTGTPGPVQATIAFSAPTNTGGVAITSYKATCTTLTSNPSPVTATGSSSPIVVSGLVNGALYSCSVQAINAVGTGAASGTVNVTPTAALVAPTINSANNTTFTVGSFGSFNVTATGNPNPTISLSSGTLPSGVLFTGGAGSATISGTAALGAGTVGTYNLTIKASNSEGAPSQAFTLTIAKRNQAVNFTAPADQPYSASTITLGATSSLGLTPITYNVTTPSICSVAGSTLTMLQAGVCTLSANQAGDADTNAGTSGTRNFTISLASQSITFGAQAGQTFIPGGTFPLSPVASASSGLAIAYSTSTSGVCSVAGTTVTMIALGTCTIVASQPGDARYSAATPVQQDIVLSKASQVITFPAQTVSSRTFSLNGTFAISPVATASSGLAIAYSSLSPTVCSVSGTTVTMLAVGNCIVAADQAGNATYFAAATASRTVQINPALPGAPTIGNVTPGNAHATIEFTPPSDDGGSAITAYTATCTPGPVTQSETASPIIVTGMTNGTVYTCSVTATNAAGIGPASATANVTPAINAASGASIWDGLCSTCHGAAATGARFNAADPATNTVLPISVLEYVRRTRPEMASNPLVQALTTTEMQDVVAYITGFTPVTQVTTAPNTPKTFDVADLTIGTTSFTGIEVVTPPANGVLSTFGGSNGVTVTYTPNIGFTGVDTFVYRGINPGAVMTEGTGLYGSNRTATITVSGAVPLLTVTLAGSGTGSVASNAPYTGIQCGADCSEAFAASEVVTLMATPTGTSTFAGWTGACSGTASCTVTMDASRNVIATFVVPSYSLVVDKAGSTGTGGVSSSPAGIDCGATCSAGFEQDTVVILTAAPSASSSFTGWSGAGCAGTGTCLVSMDAAKAVTAVFNVVPHNLTVEKFVGGAGTGTVTSSPAGISCTGNCTVAFNHDTVVTLTATPDVGSSFGGWTGACTGTGACIVTMDAVKTVGYAFHPQFQTLTVGKSGTGAGTITDSGFINCGSTCSGPFALNASVTLTATPAPGSVFAGWSGACTGSGTCNVTMSGARSVTATFNTAVVAASADLSIGYSASPYPGVAGQDVTFTLTVVNNGPSAATGVVVQATVPVGSTFMSAGSGCVQAGGVVTCTVGALANGAQAQVSFVARPSVAGTLASAATVDGDQADPSPSDDTASLQLPVDAAVAAPRLSNISTRMQVLGGNDVLIGGFVIGGSASKTVVVRARGPSLVPFGITNALANPTLQLVRSSDQAVIATNDDWQGSANAAAISASGFAPSNNLESAILMSLPPGAYTAIVSGVNGGTGVGIVEVFEVDTPEMPLANISTRGQVLTGNDVMIGGFVVQGTTAQTLVIRARGPSLVPFGITNALANPTLQLVRSSDQAIIGANDDWQSNANAATLASSGFAPSNPLESALLVTLPPGAYTVIVSGVGGGTGVGIVEVFAQ